MKSDIYTDKHGIETIISEVERIGIFYRLSPSAVGKLRLLAEEMLGLTVRLFDNLRYEFYVEREEKCFTLNLLTETAVTQSKKDKMLSLSKNGENKATKGIFGKISGIFESLLIDDGTYEQILIPYYDGMGISTYFSLSVYRNELPQTDNEDQWDGLEKSIIATLAKDVIIGVRNKRVEMIVVIDL